MATRQAAVVLARGGGVPGGGGDGDVGATKSTWMTSGRQRQWTMTAAAAMC